MLHAQNFLGASSIGLNTDRGSLANAVQLALLEYAPCSPWVIGRRLDLFIDPGIEACGILAIPHQS